ncbi:MAG TPA: MerR family transcriptional regulator [Kofleriaceae bacterium]|nr:MerR family transcriptional regulator [Kofleriaceae bacterium]
MTSRTRQPGPEMKETATVRTVTGEGTRSLARVASMIAHSRARRGAGAGAAGPSGPLAEDELRAIEAAHAEGMTAVQIVDIFAARGLRFSEATFRKYVQLGLVPRSRRIGRKGKHRGSLGVYPAKAVRRIAAVRRLMDEGRTIEEIQTALLRFADVIETLEEGMTDLFGRFETELASPRFEGKAGKNLRRELDDARRDADELLKRLDDLSQKVGRPQADTFGGTGAAGSAEELL